MITGIQIIGIIFVLIMLYLTFLYYKKNSYGYKSAILWAIIWIATLVMLLLPRTIYGLMQALQIERTADFFVLGAAVFFSLLIFYLYITVKKLNKKMEALVMSNAMKSAEKPAKKKSGKK